MSRHRLAASIAISAVILGACAGGSGGSSGSDEGATTSHSPADVSSAVAGFVDAMQAGDGGMACAYLKDDEKALFVKNAATVADFADAAESCETVVAAFPKVAGERAAFLDGTLENVSVAGDFASGSWTFRMGDQRVLLTYGDAGWQFMSDSNDFPSSLLHINE